MNCLFCNIAKKAISAEIIGENDHAIAFLDIHPRAPGHTVIVPKNHSEDLLHLPEDEINPLFGLVKETAEELQQKLGSQGFTIGMNQGRGGRVEIDHLHIHVIPRFIDDKGKDIQSVVSNIPEGSIQDMAKKIREQ